MASEEFITVAIFTLPHEMAVSRARLEWEGIECFAKDEHTVAAHPLYSNVIGGIKLQVRISDVARAREILFEAGTLLKDEQPVDLGREVSQQLADILRFPSVPAKHMRLVAWGLIALVVVLLVLLA
ncbi:MAG: DUF2007 domain-containing protein [Flavobacteriales bacterium]|nr:DUF2007 domain-containing protein [Flavobacteriales bacterium]